MALLRTYEIPGTGVEIENAYHVVTNVKVEKRIADIPPPVDNSRPDGKTPRDNRPGTEIFWKAGYIAEIAVTIWKNKAARDAGAKPIGFIGTNPSDNQYGASIGTEGMDHHCRFFLDITSPLDEFAQAYNHLMTTEYYIGSTQI